MKAPPQEPFEEPIAVPIAEPVAVPIAEPVAEPIAEPGEAAEGLTVRPLEGLAAIHSVLHSVFYCSASRFLMRCSVRYNNGSDSISNT